jgi:hypothetical protein
VAVFLFDPGSFISANAALNIAVAAYFFQPFAAFVPASDF